MKHSKQKKTKALKAIATGRPLTEIAKQLKVTPVTLASWRDRAKAEEPKVNASNTRRTVKKSDTSIGQAQVERYLIELGREVLIEKLKLI